MKRLYLDVCTLCRPFDDQNAIRIRLETDALNLILRHTQGGSYTLVVSPVHRQEIGAITDAAERLSLLALLREYGITPPHEPQKVRARAEQLYALKFGVADAAHLAFAEAMADCFLTCDDKLLKKCHRSRVRIPAMSPVEFCVREVLQ